MTAEILVVDDDPAIRRVLRLTLERHAWQVTEAGSAAEALAAVTAGAPPDAVVCDIRMPDVDGLTLYDQLLEVAPALHGRVIFLTAANRDPEVHVPIERRGVPLLGKLDDLELVADAVRIALLRRMRP